MLIDTEFCVIPPILPNRTDGLYDSLRNNEFFVLYQPIFDISSHGVFLCVGAEALLRLWQYGKYISACYFIDCIKSLPEFRYSVSKFVVSRVIEDAKQVPSIQFSINLFSDDLRDNTFVDWLLSAVAVSGQNPDRFIIEINECAADCDYFSENIFRLKKEGIKIALDDWGKEESNLSRLLLYPNYIKIDKMFAPDEDNPDSLKCCLITQFAGHLFNAETIIEGVENKFQLQIAKTMGIDKAQGFLWSKAIPLNRLIRNYVNG